MLNLNGSLTKAGVTYSTLWSEDFTDEFFLTGLKSWLTTGMVKHKTAHVKPLARATLPPKARSIAKKLADDLRRRKGDHGRVRRRMHGHVQRHHPRPAAEPHRRLQGTASASRRSTTTATQVTDDEARAGVRLAGQARDEVSPRHRTRQPSSPSDQVLWQCKMYVAALRIADDFGCDTIGIQYQQGLKDLLPASDLVEGTLNNSDRPPVKPRRRANVLSEGEPLPHFNEVDECAGLDGLITYRVHTRARPAGRKHAARPALGRLGPQRHDLTITCGSSDQRQRAAGASYSAADKGTERAAAAHVLSVSAAAPFAAFASPARSSGSRVFVDDGRLKMDLGRAKVVELPPDETERRWKETTPQWPIMHAVTYGVTRDQMMARHKANHIQVVYANSAKEADLALYTKASLAAELGLEVSLCGTKADGTAF